ncbi:DUF1870 family protein [Photorhabdus luminescens]|uniref:Aca2/YdiL-like domain-containing protein n=1 Tax=Photorhabdus luminescens TaxID=29488 RepID=UPI002240BAFF|nr:DUF1870 family protein [Photorhabdus luminescens]MCW7763393.1 YdiL family protein [Photorhabdus luminescens subsp. venezuelensis]
MTNKELQALRKLLMLDVTEAAKFIGKVSTRSWQYWETGRSAVPSDVKEEMLDLMAVRLEMMSEIDKKLVNNENIELKFYSNFADFEKDNPGGNVVTWRLSQSVAALYYTEGHAALI